MGNSDSDLEDSDIEYKKTMSNHGPKLQFVDHRVKNPGEGCFAKIEMITEVRRLKKRFNTECWGVQIIPKKWDIFPSLNMKFLDRDGNIVFPHEDKWIGGDVPKNCISVKIFPTHWHVAPFLRVGIFDKNGDGIEAVYTHGGTTAQGYNVTE